MTLVLIEADMRKIRQFPARWVTEQIDILLKPHHLKWVYGNYYGVEPGYDAEEAVEGAIAALQATAWLRGALHIQVVRRVVKRRLEQINTSAMKSPAPGKLEQARKNMQGVVFSGNKPVYPNPIMIDKEDKLVDGYTTYLLMKERGLKEAVCILVQE